MSEPVHGWSRATPRIIPLSEDIPLPSRLPRLLAPFIGRHRELDRLRPLLLDPEVRLLTLTGPGGVGKTRLAIEAATGLTEQVPGGIHFVSLAPITDPAQVLAAIARTLDAKDDTTRSYTQSLRLMIGDRPTILILDNVEQVLAAAPVIGDLLASCPSVRILATSRSVLRVYGERTFVVPPMSLAASGSPRHPATLAEIMASDAVQLFVSRTEAVRPDFSVTSSVAASVDLICRRLDALPLAIELATARMRVVSPQVLLERLDRRLPLLVDGPRDAPARQQTLRATIAWSYDLLAPDERELFRRLSVFSGGFTLTAAEAIGNTAGNSATPRPGEPERSVFDLLSSLVGMSLLQQRPEPEGTPRFEMLETVREFAGEALVRSGDADAVLDAHLAHFIGLADRTILDLLGSRHLSTFLELDTEYPNLLVALGWAVQHRPAAALRLVARLAWYWGDRGLFSDGVRWLELALDCGQREADDLRAAALAGLSLLTWAMGDNGAAEQLAVRSLTLSPRIARSRIAALCHYLLGRIFASQGRWELARQHLTTSRTLCRDLGEYLDETNALHHLGTVALGEGDLAGAERLFRAALGRYEQYDLTRGRSWGLNSLGRCLRSQGRMAEAAACFRESLSLMGAADDNYATVPMAGLARIAAESGHTSVALRVVTVLEARRGLTGMPVRQQVQPDIEAVLAITGNGEPEHSQPPGDAGTTRALLDAIDVLLAEFHEDGTLAADADIAAQVTVRTDPLPFGQHLTPRERDVLRLLVEGQSDREIAAALGITYRTTTTYISRIFTKLDVSSRTAAATFAIRRGLV